MADGYTTSADPVKRYCSQKGMMCELANERGFCSITACTKDDEYIKRKEAIVALHGGETVHIPSLMLADKRIVAIPAADVVEKDVVAQIQWERDTAVAQLAEIGKSLGEKMDDVAEVVRCRKCRYYDPDYGGCKVNAVSGLTDDNYCSWGEAKDG